MNNSGLVKTARNPDLITFKILIDGAPLSDIHLVQKIVVSSELNRVPQARIVFSDGDSSTSKFNSSDAKELKPGSKIEITAGYHSEEESIFKGIIIKQSIQVRNNSSKLIIDCKDKAVKMTLSRKSTYFRDMKDSDVFKELIERNGLSAEVEATTFKHPELVQYHVSDWDFLITRAQALGKICVIEGGKISIHKPKIEQKVAETVQFGSSLIEFDSEIDARYQSKKVKASYWDQADQTLVELDADDPKIALNGDLNDELNAGYKPEELAGIFDFEQDELKIGASVDNSQVQDWANADLLFRQLARVRGRLKFQGTAVVKPDTILQVDGIGTHFQGKAYISGVMHTLSNGNWTTDAQFGIDPEWFSEKHRLETPAASGLFAAIKGLQIGVVTKLKDGDEHEFRIQVHLPIIAKQDEGIWCRVSTLDAGNKRGTFFLPEIGDEVIVGFLNEDPNHGVVLGMLNSSAKPAPLEADDKNHEKGIVTRSDMRILFNDDKKSLNISTPAGKLISLDEKAGVITLSDEHKNSIKMDKNGITIETKGDLKINAEKNIQMAAKMNAETKADLEFKAEGSVQAELSSGAMAVIKGGVVKIN